MARLLAITAAVLVASTVLASRHSTQAAIGAATGTLLSAAPAIGTLWLLKRRLAGPNAVLGMTAARGGLVLLAAFALFVLVDAAARRAVLLGMAPPYLMMLVADSIILAQVAQKTGAFRLPHAARDNGDSQASQGG